MTVLRVLKGLFLWLTFVACSGVVGVGAQTAPGTALAAPPRLTAAPVHLTAEEDRQRMLGLLGLTEADMRHRPASDPKAADATNYDEAKANVYPQLPDPLVFRNGKRVTTSLEWRLHRRREIQDDFDREVLGRMPAAGRGVEWHVVSTSNERYGGVDVVTKRLAGHVGPFMNSGIKVNIDLLLMTPAHAKGPVPVLMELAFDKDFEFALSKPATGVVPVGPGHYGVDWQPVLDRGWGFAILKPTSIQADNGSGLTEGIIGLLNQGQPRKPEDWGALHAWAWGASEALRYFELDKAVDVKQVGLVGHSRFGKTALVAMAYDPSFAIVYSSSSGEGGAKLYRHIFGEQMPNLAGPALYHWMGGNFLRYGGPRTPGDLPVDNHELIALCAPRPVFIGGGASVGDGYAEPGGDAWADSKGMFLAEVAAGPVYKLMGKKGLGTTEFPAMGTAVTDGELAFRQHSGGHTPAPNWPYFLEFASRYLHAPK